MARGTIFALMAVFYVLSILTTSTTAFAQQYVTDTGFCKDVKELECIEPIASGESIDLSELQRNTNGPVLYFWGSVKNPEQSLVAHYFSRQGDCYSNTKSVGASSAGASSPSWRSALNYTRTRTLGDLTSFFFKDVKIEASANFKAIDLKVTAAIADSSPRFRTFTFRNLPCGGTVRARLMDSQGRPLAPDANNDLKSITITDTRGPVDTRGKLSALIFH